MTSDFARLAARSLWTEGVFLVDIGCAGGIDPAWRVFGDRLGALAIEASVDECRRLAAQEVNPAVAYVAAFAGLPPDHSFARRREGKPEAGRNPWERMSAARTMGRNEASLRQVSDEERIKQSVWWMTEVADAAKPIFVPELLAQRGIASVDFLKIDTDGNDLAILHSFEDEFDRLGVLGARLEVNFGGSAEDTDRTFHNTDRFMKAQGFELFDLTLRRYSAAALPARYTTTIAAQTESGRLLQGDALYFRDWCAPYWAEAAASATVDKLLKLTTFYAMFGLPDCAAEMLLRFRPRLEARLHMDAALDMLAAQTQPGSDRKLSYRDYMAAFEADDPSFYPARTMSAGDEKDR
jgi:hypothetical protein